MVEVGAGVVEVGAGAGAVVVVGADGSVVDGAGSVVRVVDTSPAERGADDPQAARTTRVRRMATARAHERPTGHYLTKW
jgi:hypothetical protein